MIKRNAIISTYKKEGVEVLAKALVDHNYTIFATKGTHEYLGKFSIKSEEIERIAKSPEMFGGRVKTLSSYLLGGVLCKERNDPDLEKNGITPIDLVFVEPYDFKSKFLKGEQDLVEDIDIGGITLFRAAAKNYYRVAVIPGMSFVDFALKSMVDGEIPLDVRKKLAGEAFRYTSYYDYMISQWFLQESETFVIGGTKFMDLRYGENPHQKAHSYNFYKPFFSVIKEGKEMSYNNIMDAWAAWELSLRLGKKSAVVVKHSSACGASRESNSLESAYESDSISAYGGVLAFNGLFGEEEADFLRDKYVEVLIASDFSRVSLEKLAKKKGLRVLKGNEDCFSIPDIKTAGNIILSQDWNSRSELKYEVVTGEIDEEMIRSLEFGWEVIKSVRSNAAIIVNGQWLAASTGGQPNRVDSVESSLKKAKDGNRIGNMSLLISDGFFPFSDSLEFVNQYGVRFVAAPMGSIRDDEIINYAKKTGITFIKVGERAFKH